MRTVRGVFIPHLAVLWLGILLVSASIACSAIGGGQPAPAQTPAPGSGDGTIQKDVLYGSGPFILPDAKVGLADLDSYKATLVLSFSGSRDGVPEEWTKTYTMLASNELSAHQLTIESIGDEISPALLFMAQVDGIKYDKTGDGACISTLIEPGNSLGDWLEPAGFLNFLVGAEEAGSETIDGLETKYYTFDQHALGLQDVTESTGEIWVASDGGYVVKYLLTSRGKADYFGAGIEGTLSYDYRLTDVNQSLEILLPDDCPPGLVDAPIPPDATQVENSGGLLSYDAPSSLEDVVAFYQERLPALGWQPGVAIPRSREIRQFSFTCGRGTT